MNEYDYKHFYFLLFFCFAISLFGLTSIPLIDGYESSYLNMAKASENAANFFIVNYNAQILPVFSTVFLFLLQELTQFGLPNEWICRLPSILVCAITAFFLYTYGTRIFNEETGFWSAIILSTMALSGIIAKLGMNYSFFVLSFTLFSLSYLHQQYWRMYIFWAFGIFNIGILGFILPIFLLFFHLLFLDKLKFFFRIHFFPGLLLIFCLISPWIFSIFTFQKINFWHNLFFLKNIFPIDIPFSPNCSWAFNILCLVIALMPWTGLILHSLTFTFSDSRNDELEKLLLLHLWWLITLIVYIVTPQQSPFLLWLICPPLALIGGWNIYRIEKNNNSNWTLSLSPWYLSCFFEIITIAFCFYITKQWEELSFPCQIMGAIIIFFSLAFYFAIKKFQDYNFFSLLHGILGTVQIVFFYIFFIPILVEKWNLQIYLHNFWR